MLDVLTCVIDATVCGEEFKIFKDTLHVLLIYQVRQSKNNSSLKPGTISIPSE